jgi:multiphosphoryl transfer protein
MTISLELSNIQLHASAANKADAIRQVGSPLVNSDHIQSGYVDSMFGREKVANTCLGNGISLTMGALKPAACSSQLRPLSPLAA